MGKATKKQIEIEFITFDELVQYGKNQGVPEYNGMPWSFDYKGHSITHENDTTYLIPTLEGNLQMTPNDVLITGIQGEIYPCKKDIFELSYDLSATLVNFGKAVEATKQGKRIARIGWNGKGLFVFKQIDSVIPYAVIEKMQSLPQSVKDVFAERYNEVTDNGNMIINSEDEFASIRYSNQFAIVNPNNTICGWTPSPSDAAATDWYILG